MSKLRWVGYGLGTVLLVSLLIALPILLAIQGTLKSSDLFTLLSIVFSWPAVAAVIGLLFFTRFRAAIDFFIKNIGSMRFPGGFEIQRQNQPPSVNDRDDEIEGPDVAGLQEPPEEVSEALETIEQGQEVTEAEIRAIRNEYGQLVATASSWKFSYLSLYFVTQTKNVLNWFARSPPQTRETYESLWEPYIPDGSQRTAILGVLLQYGMLSESEGFIRITQEGYSFLQFIDYVPTAPRQQGA